MLIYWGLTLTWHEIENSSSKGFVEATERGVVNESHDAYEHAKEACHDGQDHKCTGGIPVSCNRDKNKKQDVLICCTLLFMFINLNDSFLRLTNAVGVYHAFPRHAVAPQALVHVTAGLAILHPVICSCGDHQQYISNPGTE